jgi:hypothetical protein
MEPAAAAVADGFASDPIFLSGEGECARGGRLQVVVGFQRNVNSPGAAVEGSITDPEGMEAVGSSKTVLSRSKEEVKGQVDEVTHRGTLLALDGKCPLMNMMEQRDWYWFDSRGRRICTSIRTVLARQPKV